MPALSIALSALPLYSCSESTTNSSAGSVKSSTSQLLALKLSNSGDCSSDLPALAGQVVNLRLIARHALDIIGQRGQLARVGLRRFEQEQFGELLLVLEILIRPFFQEDAELAGRSRRTCRIPCASARRACSAPCSVRFDLIFSSGALCCKISRDTLSGKSGESTTPRTKRRYLRQQRLAIVEDEDALDVKLQALVRIAPHQVERLVGRHVKQGLELQSALRPCNGSSLADFPYRGRGACRRRCIRLR